MGDEQEEAVSELSEEQARRIQTEQKLYALEMGRAAIADMHELALAKIASKQPLHEALRHAIGQGNVRECTRIRAALKAITDEISELYQAKNEVVGLGADFKGWL